LTLWNHKTNYAQLVNIKYTDTAEDDGDVNVFDLTQYSCVCF